MKKPFILTFGSCGWDMIFSMDKDGNKSLIYEEEGRKNSHQALAAKRASAESMLVSFVGNDDVGKKVLDSLNNCGIDTHFIKVIDGETTEINHQILDPKTKDYSLIRFPANLSYYYTKDMVDEYKEWILKSDAVILVSKQNKDFLEEIIDFCYRNNILTVLTVSHEKFDINSKKDLETLKKVSFIAGNYKEVSDLTKKNDINEIFKLLPNIIMTNGSDGVYFINNNELVHEEAIKVDNIVETNGAGDTFIGYFIVFYVEGKKKLECIRLGECASALEIQKMGVLNAIPNRRDVIDLYNKIYND